MPKTESADILAYSTVQHAIGDMIEEAARETGISVQHAKRMRINIVERIAAGSPIDSAIRLVDAVRDAWIAGPTDA